MKIELRHYCRNPHCRQKLAEPVDNERRAFCAPGCHASFYLRRCLVCERELPPGPANRKICKRSACRNEYRRFRHLFTFARRDGYPPSLNVERPPKKSIKSGSFWRDRSGRGWRWEQFGDEHWLFNRGEDVQARLILVGERYIVRLSPGVDCGPPGSLDEAKRRAMSVSLARLPLEPRFAERIARQGNDVEGWLRRYIVDPAFRLAEEIPAHRAEYRMLCQGNRAERRRALALVAGRLASRLYGSLISVSEAKRLLTEGI